MRGRPSAKIDLNEHEEAALQSLLRRHTTGQGMALRARIVLACARGLNNIEVSAESGASKQTVSKWRRDHRQVLPAPPRQRVQEVPH